MLSNKDFSQLLQGKQSSSSDNQKVRFDLNQIRTWDRQNEAQLHRKGKHKHHVQAPHFDEEGEEEEVQFSQEYRDRAKERREDSNPDYVESMDVIAKLDVEQTKFLGGDIDHTYLVKGLDYALLRKAREQVRQAQEIAAYEAAAPPKEITTHTPLGAAMKQYLTRNSVASVPTISAATNFSLLCYVFEVKEEHDIPRVLYRSKQDVRDNDAMCVSVPTSLLSSISTSVKTAAKHRSGAKKSDYYSNEEVKSFHTKPATVKSVDIFEDVGRFDPRAALEEMVSARASAPATTAATTTSKYFDAKISSAIQEQPLKSDDLLAPVKQLIHKETMRTAKHSIVVEEGVKHRDIIGGSKVAITKGDAMDISKEYDTSQFELDDYGGYSDEEDEEGFGGRNTGRHTSGGAGKTKKKGPVAQGPASKRRK